MNQNNYVIHPLILELGTLNPIIQAYKTSKKPSRKAIIGFLSLLSLELFKKRYMHEQNNELYALSRESLKCFFNKNQLEQIDTGKHLFNQYFEKEFVGNSYQRVCNGWRMQPELQKEYLDFLEVRSKSDQSFVTYPEHLKGGIREYTEELKSLVPDYYTKAKLNTITDYGELDCVDINTIKNMSLLSDNNGFLTVPYEEAEGCKRLYSKGIYNLQGMKKDPYRNLLLAGKNDIDIQNCFPSLQVQYYEKTHGQTLGNLKEYTEYTDSIREAISQQTDVPIPVIKKCLLAIANGSKLIVSSMVYSELTKSYLPDDVQSYFNRLNENMLFKGIVEDQRLIFKDFGSNPRAVSTFFMRIERDILDVVYQYQAGRDPLQLLVHDGYVTEKPIKDLLSLEGHIEETTGYNIRFKQETISL